MFECLYCLEWQNIYRNSRWTVNTHGLKNFSRDNSMRTKINRNQSEDQWITKFRSMNMAYKKEREHIFKKSPGIPSLANRLYSHDRIEVVTNISGNISFKHHLHFIIICTSELRWETKAIFLWSTCDYTRSRSTHWKLTSPKCLLDAQL